MNTNVILIILVVLTCIIGILTFRMYYKLKKNSKNKLCSNENIVLINSQKEEDKKLSYHISKYLSKEKHSEFIVHLHKIHPKFKENLHNFYNDKIQFENHKPITEIMYDLSVIFRKNKDRIITNSLINDYKNDKYKDFKNKNEKFTLCQSERAGFRVAVKQIISKVNGMSCLALISSIEAAICTATCEYGFGEVIDTAISVAAKFVCRQLLDKAEEPLVNWLSSKVGC